MRGFQAVLLGLSAVALSACFESKQALITESDSVTPIRPGAYVSSESSSDFKVTITGSITNVTEIEDGKAEVETYLMRPLRPGYFVVLQRSTLWYGLIAIDHQQITKYEANSNCDRLEELAFEKDVPLSKFGVSGLKDDRCAFDKFDKLAAAFGMLLDNGKVEVETTYQPKGQKVVQPSAAPKQDNAQSAFVDAQRELNHRGLTLDNLLDFIRARKDQMINRPSTDATATPTDATHH